MNAQHHKKHDYSPERPQPLVRDIAASADRAAETVSSRANIVDERLTDTAARVVEAVEGKVGELDATIAQSGSMAAAAVANASELSTS